MKTLPDLKAAADMAADAFNTACRPHYADGIWGAYRAFDRGDDVPATVRSASDAYIAAAHAFYLARDGAHGFLGSRGV